MNQPANAEKPRQSTNDLHLLDAFLESLFALSSSAKTRPEFYGSLAKNIVPAAEASGAMVVAVFPDSSFSVLQSEFSKDSKAIESSCHSFIDRLAKSAEGKAEPSFLTQQNMASGHACYVSQNWTPTEVRILFLLVRKSPKNESLNQVFADLVTEISNITQAFEEKWSLRHLESKSKAANQFANMVVNVASARSTRAMYMHATNDLNVFAESNRVCLFDPGGHQHACSGVASVSSRSRPIRGLGQLARSAIKRNQSLEIRAGKLSELRKRERLWAESVLDGNPEHTIVIVPLRQNNKNYGAVSFEYFDSDKDSDKLDQQTRIHSAVQALAPVLWRQKRYSSIPFLNFLTWFFHDFFHKPIRFVTISLVLLGLLAAGLIALSTTNTTFEIAADGQLLPEIRRDVFAPSSGTIEKVMIEEGSEVTNGQQTLLIRSIELEQDYSKTEGDLAEAFQTLTNLKLSLDSDKIGESGDLVAERTEISSQIEAQKIRIATLEKRLKFLDKRSAALKICSPLQGSIISRELKQRLQYKPVERGEHLYSVAALHKPWIVELDINEAYNAYLVQRLKENQDGLKVRFRVSSDPSQVFEGKLRKLNYIEKPGKQYENKRFISAEVEFESSELGDLLRIGTGVSARIDCGERSYLFLLTYELRNKIRSWFFLGSSE